MYLPACRLQVYHYRRRRNCQHERLGCPKQHEDTSNKNQGTSHLQDPIQATANYTLPFRRGSRTWRLPQRGYRWETTSKKFLTLAPLPHMRSESYDLTASSPMSSTSLLEPPLLLPFFMPLLHGMDSQIKVIASVSTASLLGCDVVDICLETFRVSPPSLMRRIENSSGPFLTTQHTSYIIISSTSLNPVTPFVLEHITSSFPKGTIRTLSRIPPMRH